MSDDFVRDLEEELVAAARFRAARRARRVRLPRLSRRAVRGALVGLAALVLAIVLAALALERGDDRAADQRRGTPPSGVVVPLPAMVPGASCHDLPVRDEPAAGSFPEIAMLARPQRRDDAIAPPQGNEITWLPVRSFDSGEPRLAKGSAIHVVPSLGVPLDGRCRSDDGAGLCLVRGSRFRCFTKDQVDASGSLALAPGGVIVGIVPDGIAGVTLTAGGESVTAEVVENVYEARLPVPTGTDVRVVPRPADAGCRRTIGPELLDRVAVLRRPADEGQPPRAALDAVEEWRRQLDTLAEAGARFWGDGDGLEFWAVPVVPRAAGRCAPASGVCIVAVTEDERADAQCVWGEDELRKGAWRLTPLLPGNASIYGIVADGVTGARVTIDGETAEVGARDNVIGGVLPFPYRDNAKTHVELIRRPRSCCTSPRPARRG